MKKKYVLKKWVKVALGIIGVGAILYLGYLAFRITPEEEEAFNRCVETGQSIEACKKNVLGMY